MPTLSSKRIRIAADAALLDAPQDLLSGLTPAFFRGNDLTVEFALFNKGVLQDVTNISSVTLEVKPSDESFTPPDASATPVMSKTIAAASLNAGLTLSDWNNAIAQHGVLSFSATEANVAAGPHWMSLWVITTGSPGKVITVAAGPLNIREDGSAGTAGTPPAPTSSYYTSTQSDARYLQQGANLSDIASPTSARSNLGLGTAAVINTGTSSGNVPVLDGSGLLPSGVIPPVDVSTLGTKGGVMLNGGWMTIPALTLGRSDFDFLFLIKREAFGSEQYLFAGNTGALSLRFFSNDKLRVGLSGVGDVLESSATVVNDTPVWIRLKRSGGFTRLYVNSTEVGSLADAVNYTGAISVIGAADSSGTTPFKGTMFVASAWNRGIDDPTLNEYKQIGGGEWQDRWGSMTNIFSASSLVVGKRVYLKTSGTEAITINGTTYKDGTGGTTNATGGLEINVTSSTVSGNTLTSASTLRYIGVLYDLDMAVGVGYQLHDKSGNAAHAVLSETGTEHVMKKREWQLITTLSAAGYLGGSARAIVPSNHILARIFTIGGNGITISMGEAPAGTTIVTSSACTTGVVGATIGSLRSSNNRLYVNYVSGTGSVTLLIKGYVE